MWCEEADTVGDIDDDGVGDGHLWVKVATNSTVGSRRRSWRSIDDHLLTWVTVLLLFPCNILSLSGTHLWQLTLFLSSPLLSTWSSSTSSSFSSVSTSSLQRITTPPLHHHDDDHDGRGLNCLIFVPLQPSKPLAPDSGRKCSKLLHKREIIWAGDYDVENRILKPSTN